MSRSGTTITACLLIGCLCSSFLLIPRIEAAAPSSSMEDVLFISSPVVARRASLGFSGLLADIYWMRVTQYFGRKHQKDSMEYKSLAPLLDIVTTLDPNLTLAYEWGSTFLDQPPPSGAGDSAAAMALIRKGIQNNPDNWHLYLTLAFLQYLGQHDYAAAAKTFEEGSRVPNANALMKVMAAKMLTDAGSLETARYMWESIYEQSPIPDLKRNARLHLDSMAVDEQVTELESLISQFRERLGRNPMSWRELVSVGAIRGIPLDPSGEPYVLSDDGRVVVSNPKRFPFIHKGNPS